MTPDEQLRSELELLEDAVPTASPPRLSATPQQQRSQVLLLLALLAILLLIAVPSWLSRGPVSSEPSESPQETGPRASASKVPSAAPSVAIPTPSKSALSISWSQKPVSIGGAVMYDEELGMWLAFGTNRMWTSGDGAAWQVHPFEGQQWDQVGNPPTAWPTNMVEATRQAGRLWAAGVFSGGGDDRRLLMWSSTDGRNWEIVPQDGPGYIANGIASNGSRLAIAEYFFGVGSGAVLSSTDAQNWIEHQPGGTASMMDVYGDADGFVAVGFRGYTLQTPAIWASSDGTSWMDVSPRSDQAGLWGVLRMSNGTYVAAGVSGDGAISIWTSHDRITWALVMRTAGAIFSSPYGVLWPIRVASDAATTILVANTASGLRAWASNDGQSWGEVLPVVGKPWPSYAEAIGIRGSEVVLVGATGELWLGRLGSAP